MCFQHCFKLIYSQCQSNRSKINGGYAQCLPGQYRKKFEDCIQLLEEESLKDCFSHFYILPTFFNSDLDRGFSIINYDVNQELVQDSDLDRLKALGIQLKFDIVLNHLSVASPQFKDLLENGEAFCTKTFLFIGTTFAQDESVVGKDGVAVPKPAHLSKLLCESQDSRS